MKNFWLDKKKEKLENVQWVTWELNLESNNYYIAGVDWSIMPTMPNYDVSFTINDNITIGEL